MGGLYQRLCCVATYGAVPALPLVQNMVKGMLKTAGPGEPTLLLRRRISPSRHAVGTPVAAAGCTGFMDRDPGEQGQTRLESVPDPDGQVLAGWIFQSGDVIEAAMVQLLENRREGGAHFGKIADPTQVRVDRAFEVQFDLE